MPLLHRIAVSNGNKQRKAIAHRIIAAMDRDTVAMWNRALHTEANCKAAWYDLPRSKDQPEPPLEFENPNTCVICGRYLTIDDMYDRCRCLDPAHWQASGEIAPSNFYKMAQICEEQRRHFVFQGRSRELCLSMY